MNKTANKERASCSRKHTALIKVESKSCVKTTKCMLEYYRGNKARQQQTTRRKETKNYFEKKMYCTRHNKENKIILQEVIIKKEFSQSAEPSITKETKVMYKDNKEIINKSYSAR